MARRKKYSRKSKKIPMLATAGIAAYALNIYNDRGNGMNGIRWQALGIENNGTFNSGKFVQVMTPPVVGVVGSALASKFKLNRYLSSVPFVKL